MTSCASASDHAEGEEEPLEPRTGALRHPQQPFRAWSNNGRWIPRRLSIEPVELPAVVRGDPPYRPSVEGAERLLDRLARVGPGAVRMRVVAGPHHALRADERDQLRGERLLLEGREDLAPEELARARADLPLAAPAVQPEGGVHAVQEVREPA